MKMKTPRNGYPWTERMWSEIAAWKPPYPHRGHGRKHLDEMDEKVFRAILMLLWMRRPLSRDLGGDYPNSTTVFHMLHWWSETGALEKMWLEYLSMVGRADIRQWLEKFALNLECTSKTRKNAQWFRDMRSILEVVAAKRRAAIPAGLRLSPHRHIHRDSQLKNELGAL